MLLDKEITAEPFSPSPCPLPAKERGHWTAISLRIPGALDGARTGYLPGLVVASGPAAQFAWEEFLFGYVASAGIGGSAPEAPLFRSAIR